MVQYTRVGFFARVFSLDINQHSMIISMDRCYAFIDVTQHLTIHRQSKPVSSLPFMKIHDMDKE